MDEIEKLIEQLGDANETKRELAVKKLFEKGNHIVPRLIDETHRIYARIQETGWMIGENECHKRAHLMRDGLLNVLRIINDPRTIQLFIDALADSDSQDIAKEALFETGEPAVCNMIKAFGEKNAMARYEIVELVDALESPKAQDLLFEASKDQDYYVRAKAVFLLSKYKNEKVAKVLFHLAFHDPMETIRDAAREFLIDFGSIAFKIFLNSRDSKYFQIKFTAHEVLDLVLSKISKIKTLEEIQEFFTVLDAEQSKELRKTKEKRDINNLMTLTRFRIELEKRKNQLAEDKGILLDDKPKPPKGKMYQQIRRQTNG